jgi:hypothetical protein
MRVRSACGSLQNLCKWEHVSIPDDKQSRSFSANLVTLRCSPCLEFERAKSGRKEWRF